MRLINNSTTRSIFDTLKENVTVTSGSTTVMSNENGVTIEDNGNVINASNGANVDIQSSASMDLMSMTPEEDIPVEDGSTDIEEPTEDFDIDVDTEEEIEEPTMSDEEISTEEDDLEDEEELEESSMKEEVLEKKDEETEEEINNSKSDADNKGPVIKLSDTYREIDVDPKHITATPSIAREINSKKSNKKVVEENMAYNQSQNVDIFQNPEFDYQILDITELDNVDSGDVRSIDMANILNNLDESLTEFYGNNNYVGLNSFLTRKGVHKKTNESYSSAILEISLPKLNKFSRDYKNTFFLEVYGNKLIKECVVRDSTNHIIKEYSGKSINPVEHFKNVIIDLDRSRMFKEEVSDEAYAIAEKIANKYEDTDFISWEDFDDSVWSLIEELNLGISEDDYWDFAQDVRSIMSQYGWATIFEGENEGGLTTNSDLIEAVEMMVNTKYSDRGINFADGKAIEKDEKRQENHMKQHAKFDKKKKFDASKEPDQNNTTGETLEDITDTEKTPKLPKAKKTKVDAKTIKVKEIKEDVSIRGVDDNGNKYSYDKKITKPYYVQIIFHYNGEIKRIKEFDSVEEAKSWIEENKNTSNYDYSLYSSNDNELIDYITESANLKESVETSNAFWNAGFEIGDTVDTDEAGVVEILGLNQPENYILIKRPTNRQAYVAVLEPHLSDNKLSWGRGHYFDTENAAKDYFNSLSESVDINSRTYSMDEAVPEILSIPGYFFNEIGPANKFIEYYTKYDIPVPDYAKNEFTNYDNKIIEVQTGNAGNAQTQDIFDKSIFKIVREVPINEYKELLSNAYVPSNIDQETANEVKQEILGNLSESAKLTESDDELLDEPIVTDGTEPEDELNEGESSVAIFHRKPASVDAMRAAEQNGITVNKSNYRLVGTKELSGEEFDNFANHLSSGEFEWLKEFNDTSNSGEFKCVEVINTDDDSYSLLVDPQGYNYARYCAIKEKPTEDGELLEPEDELLDEPIDEEPIE